MRRTPPTTSTVDEMVKKMYREREVSDQKDEVKESRWGYRDSRASYLTLGSFSLWSQLRKSPVRKRIPGVDALDPGRHGFKPGLAVTSCLVEELFVHWWQRSCLIYPRNDSAMHVLQGSICGT